MKKLLHNEEGRGKVSPLSIGLKTIPPSLPLAMPPRPLCHFVTFPLVRELPLTRENLRLLASLGVT